ncbi:PQQ-binding-like beta-propeller repeat protein [Streptomyces sp. NBC_00059]|uniref:outer membrane protein assembly factor BamB family protein n=1 Tax=Streptomyces sp. NBC_00059 TaxID=2975635 RepID=UPI0022570706|nr:PQQ-binding-like beta-propeller repeat protein [Streptomyces sp. NBC_00059]MCX5416592.1 PQQ-binding-like beta-propeller repeat protein [Streptomyces sp. NBC_00059]
MEALRQDDPRRFGPYTALARLRESASAVHFLARGAEGDELAVVTAARPALASVPAFRRRFRSEAGIAERLAGGWVQPPLAAPEDDALWTAAAYVPAVTLAEAIGFAGPLPERAVRILGAGLAETLSRVHATGAVLQGLAPETVLLAEDGPRLTAFGPLGAAVHAEAREGGQLSVRLGYLTPEQVAGKEVGPASDLFVLGLLLAYAATGTTPLAEGPPDGAAERIAHGSAELGSVPDELRALIASCLAKDPADRPGAGAVAAELALEGAAGLAKGGWLPATLSAAMADQSERAHALEPAQEPPVQDEVPGGGGAPTDDAAPAERGAPGDGTAVADGGVPEAGAALAHAGSPEAGETPADAPHAPPAESTGDIGEDSRTTRFLGTGARAPQSDRATAQLALPRELPGAVPPQAPAPALPPAPAPSGPYGYAYPTTAAPGVAPAPLPQPLPGAAPATAPAPEPAPAPAPATSRRALLTTVAAGAAGLLLGGAAVAAVGSDEPAAAGDDKPRAEPRPTVPGRAPDPRWIYTHPASGPAPLTAGLWRDDLLVLTDTGGATAVDLKTGRKRWERAEAADAQTVLATSDGLCFLATPSEFLWLSPEDGRIRHRVRYADQFTGVPGMKVAPVTGLSGSVLWFTGSHTVTVKAPKPKKGKKPGKDTQVVKAYFFAYDIARREEVWRIAVPAGRAPGTPAYRLIAVRDADLVVRQDAATLTPADVAAGRGKAFFRCFDRTTGKLLWNRQFGTVAPGAGAAGDAGGRLYAGVGDDLQAFETGTGKPVWTLNGTASSVFGSPMPAGTLLHITNRNQEVGTVERATGRLLWRRSTEVPLGGGAPVLTLGGGGKTLLAADTTQVTAFAAEDGRRLWKFQDIGAQDPKGATVSAPYRVLASKKTAVVQRERAFYALPVE